MPRSQTPKDRMYTHDRYYARGAKSSGQLWTTHEITAITDSNRPPDEQLSLKLNRSILAIQVMRSKMKARAR